MNKIYFLLISLLFAGCASVQQTIYLQNVDVNGPVNNPPIFVSDDRSGITISPRLSFNSINQLAGQKDHSNVNSSGFYQVDTLIESGKITYKESNTNSYAYTQNNVKWNLPQVSAALDVDLPLSRKISLFGSINYSSKADYNLTGGTFGFGFKSIEPNYAFRFNVGGTIQQYRYDASTIVVTTISPLYASSYTRVDFYRDVDIKSNFDLFANLTYNTILPDMPVNFYLSIGFFTQTILDYKPHSYDGSHYQLGLNYYANDENFTSSTSFLSFTPGVFMDISPSMRLVLGINILKNNGSLTDLEDHSTSLWYFLPMAKLDLRF